MGLFLKVGTTEEIEALEAGKLVGVAGQRIAIFNQGGKYWAVEDICRDAAPLCNHPEIQDVVISIHPNNRSMASEVSIDPIYGSLVYTGRKRTDIMTTLDLKTIEAALQTRARELVRSLAERNQITIEMAADAFDESLLAAERESSAQILTQDSQLLRQVEAARNRLRDGSFGICLRCEEAIAPRRLLAIPWAAYCVSCQAKTEEGRTFRPGLARAA